MAAGVKSPGWPVVPIRTVGRTALMSFSSAWGGGHDRPTAANSFAQRDLAFVLFEVGTAFPDQAGGVHEDQALPHFGCGEAIGQQSGVQEPANADPRGARADQQEALLAQGLTDQAQAGKDASQDDGGGALDVVVEARQAARIAPEQAEGVGFLE